MPGSLRSKSPQRSFRAVDVRVGRELIVCCSGRPDWKETLARDLIPDHPDHKEAPARVFLPTRSSSRLEWMATSEGTPVHASDPQVQLTRVGVRVRRKRSSPDPDAQSIRSDVQMKEAPTRAFLLPTRTSSRRVRGEHPSAPYLRSGRIVESSRRPDGKDAPSFDLDLQSFRADVRLGRKA